VVCATGLVIAGLAAAAPATADHVTLGVADPVVNSGEAGCAGRPCTEVVTALSSGTLAAPGNGRITTWWAVSNVASTTELRVIRPTPSVTGQKYTGVATSAQQTLGTTVTRFATSLPIGSGDLIGVTILSGDVVGVAQEAGAGFIIVATSLPDGTTSSATTPQVPYKLELGALLVYTPVVSGLAAGTGSTAGGDTVTITGDHLTESTAVMFGSKPAKSFTIDSNTQITAKAPQQAAGTVDVTVVGPGGTSATGSGDRYTFAAPTATVSPIVLDFGGRLAGKPTAVKAVTLTNGGKVPVSIGAVTLGGANAADFTKVSDGCGARDVAPGKSCSVNFVFTPGAIGARQATVQLADNSSDGPHTVVLSGSGTTTVGTAPSNVFSIGKLLGPFLTVTVASSGSVRVVNASRNRLLQPSSTTGGPGSVVVGLRLTSAAAKTLGQRHEVTVKARITFTPRGGKPAVKTRRFTLRSGP
jgi:hypothetical protein